MPVPILQEYENQNARRRFPFADSASMIDTDGNVLPTDFMIDAFLYPLNMTGTLYLSSIDNSNGKLYFSTTDKSAPIGMATYSSDSEYAEVYEIGLLERQIGVVVFGSGLSSIVRGNALRTFTADATAFTPAVFVPLNQVGVRALKLPDGTYVTGDVTFEGRDGVRVTSRVASGKHILRIDVIGTIPEDCDDAPPICVIIAERIPGSRFLISTYDTNTLAVTANGLDLEDMCAQNKARRRLDQRDPCETPLVPPEDTEPGPPQTEVFPICESGLGVFSIMAPSTLGYRNPILVQLLDNDTAVPAPRLRLPYGTAISDLDRIVSSFTLPPMASGGILISFQGIGGGQTP